MRLGDDGHAVQEITMPAQGQNATSIFDINLRTGTVALVAAVLFVTTIVAQPAQAQTFTALGNFNGRNGTNPLYVTLDSGGNVYGTTYYGGKSQGLGAGTVFKATHYGSHWILTTLYNFYGHADGGNPYSGVIFGPDGALYGAASAGGSYGHGVVYKLRPSPTECAAAECTWTETVLYNFNGASDGEAPQGNLVFDRAGNLYGTTLSGGPGGSGSVYELTPSQGHWTLTVIHGFTNSSDGGEPANGVIFEAGNLYGTTVSGGSNSLGVVYEFTPGSPGWTETVLHNFAGGDDGQVGAGLTFDSRGNLFGFTEDGGSAGWGITFELQPFNGGYNYSVIYTFEPQPGGAPGYITVPVVDNAGNLYGSGTSGGSGEAGVIFELTPAQGSWNFIPLHDFSGPDGDEPGGGLALDAQGNLYGTVEYGGTGGDGVVWEVTP